jgi:pantoate--beta-alanine ligase
MYIFDNLDTWQRMRAAQSQDMRLGFVPTMGNLHTGHLSLIQRAQAENTHTLVSLFVNPTQFNNAEDFVHYPRTLAEDIAYLTENGVDYCLIPNPDEIYADEFNYQVQETQLSQYYEGAHRPGHFTGVLTVVMKLLQLARPTRAYFGEKDYQQLQLIRGMVAAYFIPVDIIGCPIIREENGLAFSSRNQRLSPAAKQKAIQFAQQFRQAPSIEAAQAAIEALDIAIDYVSEWQGRRLAAVTINCIRLIDNYAIEIPSSN